MLKEELLAIIQNDYTVPQGMEEYEAALRVIGVLGSPDPDLRDELAFTVLQQWLLHKNLLTGEQLKEVLVRALSKDQLFYKLGESGTESVFLRSFSALLIAIVLIRDNRESFLTETDVFQVIDQLVHYCKQENDFRGYVEKGGWAHAPAHVADALDECVRSRYVGVEQCQMVWQGLSDLLTRAPHVFDAEEDERIATAVSAMVGLGKVPLSTICMWLEQIELPTKNEVFPVSRVNLKHFVRSLYFRLQQNDLLGEDQHRLTAVARMFNRNR